jgi:peptidyl-prolyl cis-trans isomerase B (cyclophilin B)
LTKTFNSPNQLMQKPFQRLIIMSLLVGTLILGACDSPKRPPAEQSTSTPTPSSTGNIASNSDRFSGLPRLNGKATVLMTVKGNKQITIELDGNNAPISAGNFVDLVQKGFYNGLKFHRVIRKPQPFVVQGGDPKGNGSGGYNQTKQDAPQLQSPELQHTRGAIAMARSQSPDSASSQFYFALADIGFLDGDYAVFGKITQGLEVIDTIEQGDKITSAKVTRGIENLKK